MSQQPQELSVQDLKIHLFTKNGVGKAVDGVSFDLFTGETLGLVGESGSGKSLTALSIVGLHPAPAARIVGGHVFFRGEDLLTKRPKDMTAYRGRHIAMILQDPLSSLNPVMTVGAQIYEPLRVHQNLSGARLREEAVQLLTLLRISSPEDRLRDYPHQLSGGMRQRVAAAIALSCKPAILLADEPTTALDVTVQAAFLSLIKSIQLERLLTVLMITHDFGVVGRSCDRVAVIYAGRIVETGATWDVIEHPAHPYTRALIDAVGDVSQNARRLVSIDGQPPSVYAVPPGWPGPR